MNDIIQFDMPEVQTYAPDDYTQPPGNELGGVIATGAAIDFGAVFGAQADQITSGAFASTMSTNAAKLFGFGVKAAGGVISTGFGVAAETIYTGKMPTAQSIAETSVIAIASVLAGPPSMEALAAVFDSNGDGVLDASDAAFADFRLMVTNADGTTTSYTLSELGITSINLTADATHIVLPDGSMITGQSTTNSDVWKQGKVEAIRLAA